MSRAILTKEEEEILESMKDSLEKGIKELVDNGVRGANIEIELIWHIRKLLKSE